jgi:hypothetical protein
VTSVRGIGLLPTTKASLASGWTGFMNAALGCLFFFAVAFFFAFFFAAAICFPPSGNKLFRKDIAEELGVYQRIIQFFLVNG